MVKVGDGWLWWWRWRRMVVVYLRFENNRRRRWGRVGNKWFAFEIKLNSLN